ncbi:hypothetical protein SAMN06265337_0663 [Hymenobacter gelipurpurascens]|uniref:Uncharacterized protein n=1 Tax=Hymenobacter gelipurpurascens TaxID=89968 RepID=A0A212T9D1_9BACT|nr:hypothetical protein [Hymenobacter gelipurpurascens]SNC62404.1 hypothetical protein SAMN06265337_0663 [Hymenobacter gelipurpurascens]
MSHKLKMQLAMYQQLQRKLARARRRRQACPTPLNERNLSEALERANFFLDSLLMTVPTSHDEAVYQLSEGHPFGSDFPIF